VVGEANGSRAVGVLGLTTMGYAVRGIASGSSGVGVFGQGSGNGVYGVSTSNSGVYGTVTNATLSNVAGVEGVGAGSGTGVLGSSTSGSGVVGTTAGSASGVAGVEGTSTSSSGVGVLGTTVSGYGVRGEASGSNGYGVYGTATASNSIGVYGSASGSASAVYGVASGTGRAGYFAQISGSNTMPTVEIRQAGTGPALKLTGTVNSSTTGTANMLPVAYGRVVHITGDNGNSIPTKAAGTNNWTVSRGIGNTKGDYRITFTSADLSTTPGTQLVVQVTMVADDIDDFSVAVSTLLTQSDIYSNPHPNGSIGLFTFTPDGAFEDGDFCFTVYKP
jgi:hypothetical protein